MTLWCKLQPPAMDNRKSHVTAPDGIGPFAVPCSLNFLPSFLPPFLTTTVAVHDHGAHSTRNARRIRIMENERVMRRFPRKISAYDLDFCRAWHRCIRCVTVGVVAQLTRSASEIFVCFYGLKEQINPYKVPSPLPQASLLVSAQSASS